MKHFLGACLLLLMWTSEVLAGATLPTDPTATSFSINPTPVTIASPNPITTFGQLQTAIAAADCGTKIIIDHTVHLTSTTKITLPAFAGTCAGTPSGALAVSGSSGAKAVAGSSGASATTSGTGDNFAMITTDVALPADGTRVTIAGDSAKMPLIDSPTIGNGNYLFDCAASAHHWRIKGIHIKGVNGSPGSVGGIGCQGVSASPSTHAHDISIEQIIVEGDATWGLYSAVDLIGRNMQVVDSDLGENVKIAGTETHTILLSGGAGPYKIWNNRCADSAICLFVGGSTLTNVGVVPSDLDIQFNDFLKNASWTVGTFPGNTAKGHYECKQCQRVRMLNNTFRHYLVGAQMQAINLCSIRGNGGTCRDVTFAYNLVDETPITISLTARPTLNTAITNIVGDGTTNCASGPCVKISSASTSDASIGTIVAIRGATGTTEANVDTSVSAFDSTTVTIPIPFVHAWTGGGSITYYYPGAPANRVNIHDNVFSRSGSTTVSNNTNWWVIGSNAYGVLPVGDLANSSTGSWSFDNLRIVNNTCVDTGTQPDWTLHWLSLLGPATTPAGGAYASYYQGQNWEITNNVCQVGNGSAGYRFIEYNGQDFTAHSYQTAALNFASDPATRTFSKNVYYRPNNPIATELATLTGAEAYPANVIVTDETNIGYTNYTGTTPTNFALTNLYTWSNCSASSSSAIVTCSGATIPTTVMKGTPFKIDSDGNFGIVASRDSNTQVTLEANYHATVSGQSTFGFKGWGVGGVDPGANTALVRP